MRKEIVFYWFWVFLAAFLVHGGGQSEPLPESTCLMGTFPRQFGTWEEAPQSSPDGRNWFIRGAAAEKQSFSSVYRSSTGFTAQVEMIYVPHRKPRNQLSVFHQSLICKRGRFASAMTEEITLPGYKAMQLRFFDGNQAWRLVFWLQTWEKSFSQPFDLVCWQYWQQLWGKRSDGCFVLTAIKEPLTANQNDELRLFLSELQAQSQNWLKPLK